MDDYELPTQEPRSQGGRLGGLSLQTGVTVLLIAVIAAVLWLLLGPMPDSSSVAGLPTATATKAGVANSARTPGFAALTGTPGTPAPGGALANPVLGTQVGTPGTRVLAISSGTPLAASALTPASSGPAVRSGMFTEVTGTGIYGLRLRFGAGSDFVTIRILSDGDMLLVLDTSEEAEGETWWRVQDDLGNVGWVAEEYLKPALSPASWAPPASSPTFEANQAP
jgi:hypothetical protein